VTRPATRELEDLDNHWLSRDLRVDTYACALAGISSCEPFRPSGLKVCLPRVGLCGIAHGHRELLSDATRLLLLDPGKTYAIRHLACACCPPRRRRGGPAPAPRVCGTVLTLSGRELAGVAWPELLGASGGWAQWTVNAEIALLHAELLAVTRDPRRPPEPLVEELAVALLDAVAQRVRGATPSLRSGAGRSAHRTTAAVKSLLAADLRPRWDLDSLAAAIGCSKFYLCRSFRDVTGTTIHQYLVALRLAVATQRLAEGASDLGELAIELGFASHSHFTAWFRRCYRITPAGFRASLRREPGRGGARALGAG
jgi:AraC-like DNA-binding protein